MGLKFYLGFFNIGSEDELELYKKADNRELLVKFFEVKGSGFFFASELLENVKKWLWKLE